MIRQQFFNNGEAEQWMKMSLDNDYVEQFYQEKSSLLKQLEQVPLYKCISMSTFF